MEVVRPEPVKAFVIAHDDFGVYLGSCMGMGFWSKLDSVGQTSAVAFPTAEAAGKHAEQWECPIDALRFVEVLAVWNANRGELYAFMENCVAAGLPAWETPSLEGAAQ